MAVPTGRITPSEAFKFLDNHRNCNEEMKKMQDAMQVLTDQSVATATTLATQQTQMAAQQTQMAAQQDQITRMTAQLATLPTLQAEVDRLTRIVAAPECSSRNCNRIRTITTCSKCLMKKMGQAIELNRESWWSSIFNTRR